MYLIFHGQTLYKKSVVQEFYVCEEFFARPLYAKMASHILDDAERVTKNS